MCSSTLQVPETGRDSQGKLQQIKKKEPSCLDLSGVRIIRSQVDAEPTLGLLPWSEAHGHAAPAAGVAAMEG